MTHWQIRCNIRSCAQGLLIFALACVAVTAVAQDAQDDTVPKVDIFAGYQWLNAGGGVPIPGTSNPVQSQNLTDLPKGFGLAGAYNYNRYLALEADYGGDWNNGFSVNTFSIGPRLMFRGDGVNLFLHTLLSDNRLNTPSGSNNGIGAILGGGIDLHLWKRLDWRIVEADYQWSRHNFADFGVPPQQPGLRRSSFDGLRFRGGPVFSLGGAPPVAPTAACSAQPSQVMVGEPVTVTASPSNFNPKHQLIYAWSGTAGTVSSKDTTATIDTNGVAGGSYTATAKITDPKAKKNGMASCSASFTVKEPPKNPPTMSCSASPSTVPAGATVSISCTCTSPDSVPVTVANWTATGGTVSGSGNTATLNTPPGAGTVTVSAVCTDTRGLNASADTMVTVEMPPPPPPSGPTVQELEVRLALHSVYFPTAQPTPQAPQVGLVESQQKTLTALASDFQEYLKHKPDAHLILAGHADQRGSVPYNQALSERRVGLTKSFLIDHGVPEGSIETKAFGHQKNLTAAQVKDLVDTNPQVTPEQRQKILKNMRTILLASNRRVDVTLSTTGEESVKQYPFNAADSLTLLEPSAKAKPAAKKPAPKKMKKNQ
jgi:outer membrane protein OmpA-like peptidoglycan-associated protein